MGVTSSQFKSPNASYGNTREPVNSNRTAGKLAEGNAIPSDLNRFTGTQPANRHVKDICVKQAADSHQCWVTDCEVLADNNIALVDHNNDCVKIIDPCDKRLIAYSPVGLPSKAWALCQDLDKNLIITCGYDIVTLQLYSLARIKHITVNDWTRGIVSDKDMLVYCCTTPHPAVKIITKDGLVINSYILGSDGQAMFVCPWYIAISRDRHCLYVTDCGNSKVTCLNKKDDTESVYRHRSLKRPQGLALGPRDRLFICGQFNVHDVTTDFKRDHVILEDDTYHGICFNDKDNLIFLSYDWNCKRANSISVYCVT